MHETWLTIPTVMRRLDQGAADLVKEVVDREGTFLGGVYSIALPPTPFSLRDLVFSTYDEKTLLVPHDVLHLPKPCPKRFDRRRLPWKCGDGTIV